MELYAITTGMSPRQAEQAGFNLGHLYAAIFSVREDASVDDINAMGMLFAGQHTDTRGVENGVAFVRGFTRAISGKAARAASMTLEDKIDMLLSRQLEAEQRGLKDPTRKDISDA